LSTNVAFGIIALLNVLLEFLPAQSMQQTLTFAHSKVL
jgi:hypothetical protein